MTPKNLIMTRKFTETEKNILYKNIPLQKQGNGVGWEHILFIFLTIVFFGSGFKMIMFDFNPFFNGEEENWGSVIILLSH